MKNKSDRVRKGIVVAAVIVIIICLGVIAVSLVSVYSANAPGPEPTGSPSSYPGEVRPSGNVENEPADSDTGLSSLRIDVSESEILLDLIALLETKNVYDGTPAYVFVAKKVPVDKDSDAEDQDAIDEAVAQQYLAAYNDLISFAREAADSWSISYDEYVTYLSKCSCIQTEEYIFVCGSDRYRPLAEVFEQATNDPTVLDMEDLIARLTEFKIEE